MDPIAHMTTSDPSFGRSSNRPGWIISAIIPLLLLSALGAVYLIIDNRQSGSEIIRAQNVQAAAFRLVALIQQAESSQRGYILTGRDSYLAPFARSTSRIPDALSDLSGLAANDQEIQSDVAAISQTAQKKLEELRNSIAAFQREGLSGALPVVLSDEGEIAMERIRTLTRAILDNQRAKLAQRTESWRENSILSVVLGGITLLLTILAAVVVIRGQKLHAATLDAARERLVAVNAGLEERVAKRTADLKEANEEIQRYAHIASHDLRAPLVNIMGFSGEVELIRQEVLNIVGEAPTLSEEARDKLQRLNIDFDEALFFIKQSVDRMNRLINAILTLARSGQREFKPESLDMQAVFASIKATLQHQILNKGVRFDVGHLPTVVADRLAIEQIFGNLAENAIKYLDPERTGQISVAAVTDISAVTFIISDNGRGIAERDLDRIFDPFRRAGAQDQPGEGIGLAHVRALVRRLGGTIACESEIGSGSRFIVTLPIPTAVTRG